MAFAKGNGRETGERSLALLREKLIEGIPKRGDVGVLISVEN